jgi:MinD-like ATPase involved in chromosome partitioning or flagellar assembly
MRVLLAVDEPAPLDAELRALGTEVLGAVAPSAPARAVADALAGPASAELLALLSRAELLVVDAHRESVSGALVATCDRFGVRIVVRCARGADRRLAALYGLHTVSGDAPASVVLDPVRSSEADAPAARGRVIAVWGAAGAPGRTTAAIALAAELARDGRRVALIDADTHAPSVALASGLPDEGPGFAAACRQAERGTLTIDELERISARRDEVSVLAGINRPGRWPELSAPRVTAALEVCRDWVDDVVVDVAASLEQDEEIVSDLDGPRRNAATRAALATADLVVAVVAADPVGVSRFLRAHADLRAAIGSAPVRVLVNKTRAGVLGIDPRAQVRRTLERYVGIDDVWFAPADHRAVDAALLRGQPVLQAAGRSQLTAAIRRFVGESIEPPPIAPATRRAGRDSGRVRAVARR